jgi:homoserine kinase
VRIEPAVALHAALFIPDKPLSTAAMRSALPAMVPFADAVHNVGAAALAVAALSTGRIDLLDAATADRLHEPYRASAYPELPELIAAARSAGALGACLSGAGSTVIAFSDDADSAATIAGAMRLRATALGLAGRAAVQQVRAEGAHVVRGTDEPLPGSGASLI